jgi:molybdopterin molybdotransferase
MIELAPARHSTTATTWDDARAISREAGRSLARSRPLADERVPLAAAAERTTSSPLTAGDHLPRCDASAMDGWVVCGPGPWRVGTRILAGDPPSPHPLPAGVARPIATGGLVPPGTVAVLRSEHGEVRDGPSWPLLHALDRGPIPPGRDIRPAAEEARRGDELLPAGTVLTTPRIALAAVAGYDEIEVVARRRVGVIVLGDEVHDAGAPSAGRVRDAFAPSLPAAIASAGALFARSERCADDPDSTVAAIDSMAADLIVTTGGSSHGPTDFARSSLITLGARFLFDGVAVRPGHPVILARLPDGRIVLCLPGNPLAALLCFASFAVPLLDGAHRRRRPLAPAVSVTSDIANDTTSTRLVPCVLDDSGVTPTRWQGPAMLRGLATADHVAIVPPGGVRAGSWTPTLALPW